MHKVTIIPRGQALGVTEQLPDEDQYDYDKAYLLAGPDVTLGGRTAEEIALGDVTTGAENDLAEATRLARRMIFRWGMGNPGLVAFQAGEERPFLAYELSQGRVYSEATAARIDENIEHLPAERHGIVRRLLGDARKQLDALADKLLEEEIIEQGTLTRVVGTRHQTGDESYNESHTEKGKQTWNRNKLIRRLMGRLEAGSLIDGSNSSRSPRFSF